MQAHDSSRLLRVSLFSNAVFSSVSGVCFIAASGPLAALIGLEFPMILVAIGVSLVAFAAGLVLNAKRPTVNQREAWIAVVLDLAWVVGSVVVIFTGVLSTTGNWAVAIVADVVLVFAILQFRGLRKMQQ
ncbi:MAG: hypothetical protein Tsb009_27380 [Planctomycetaceae bacterium]